MLIDYYMRPNKFVYTAAEIALYTETNLNQFTYYNNPYVYTNLIVEYTKFPKIVLGIINPVYPTIVELVGIVDLNTNQTYYPLIRIIDLAAIIHNPVIVINVEPMNQLLQLPSIIQVVEENGYGNMYYFEIFESMLNRVTDISEIIDDTIVESIFKFIAQNSLDWNFAKLVAMKNSELINKIPNVFEFQGDIIENKWTATSELTGFVLDIIDTTLNIHASDFYYKISKTTFVSDYLIRYNIPFNNDYFSIKRKNAWDYEIQACLYSPEFICNILGIDADTITIQKNYFGEIMIQFYQKEILVFQINIDILVFLYFLNYFEDHYPLLKSLRKPIPFRVLG